MDIMIVDDDSLLLQTMANVLQREGFTITAVSSAVQALEKMKFFFIRLLF